MSTSHLQSAAPPMTGLPDATAPDVVTASLVDLDAGLARNLSPALLEQVRGWLVVRVWSVPRGPWPAGADHEPGLMGLLVVDGVIARSVSLGVHSYPELLGRGDLLRPWHRAKPGRLGPMDVSWQVLEPCRLAVLDKRFAGIVGRFPEVVDELLARAINRAQELDFNMAIAQLPLLESRILALLWHFGDRWGESREGGCHVPVRLTHTLLASLVLGRRPSVSTALTELSHRGLLSRVDDGWLLHGEPPTDLHTISRRGRGSAFGA
jgi:CRP/FNR family transcriptional regulator, cyclic AMP receptor protein